MESSPANQLPEAGSLPDGFVESSANSPSVAAEDADYKDSFIDVDQTPAENLQLDGGSRGSEKPNHVEPLPEMESSIDLLEVDDKPSESQPGDEKPTEPKESESHGDCKGIEGSLELHNGDKKKSCTAEYTERLKDQNIVSTDPKRKVVKRSLKYEKELLELTLMYQKVLSERDAAVGVRVRLESLCRELQHQNKMLMDALLKSNEVFETFKQEMEKMAKLTKEVKKENEFLKGKCEKSDFAIVRLIDEREQTKKQIEKLKNQKEKLESLCRSLQAERKQVRVESPPIDPASVQAQIDPVDKDL